MNSSNPILVFDRALVRHRRSRAVADFAAHRVLFDEVSDQLMDRLADIKREFISVLDLGAQNGALMRSFAAKPNVFAVSSSLSQTALPELSSTIVIDEEMLPFANASFDLIISNATLHWVNDLPGALIQIKKNLRPDGLFLASLLGGQTLHELRACLLEAELAVTGGISPRLSPSIELLTASGLLQRAGFTLPVADSDIVALTYPDAFALMHDLRGMGETNAHLHRLRHFTRRSVFDEAAKLYQKRYATSDGRITATFEVIFLHGWA